MCGITCKASTTKLVYVSGSPVTMLLIVIMAEFIIPKLI